jgi:hypothetical protein
MATYKPLQSVVLTSASASVSFIGIDQNYTDLVIVLNATSTGDTQVRLGFNSDTGTPYSSSIMGTDGSSTFSIRVSNEASMNIGGVGQTTGTNIIHINNYSNTNINKTVLGRYSELSPSYGEAALKVGLWRKTAAINSITFTLGTGNYSAGSTFSLYGIKSGAPQALGGDLVTTDGNYWYHTFRTTQTFTPQRPLTVDYLVVAGGGGGGTARSSGSGGGGGGAGGYRTSIGGSSLSLTPSSFTVIVGAGGSGRTSEDKGISGNDSVFSTITSTGGGGGASIGGTFYGYAVGGENGLSGGSGGGSSGNFNSPFSSGTPGSGNTPATSPSQGNNGGVGSVSANNFGAGGGGGAGAVGGNGTGSAGGVGGAGTANSISGSSVTYAGGGGGASHNGGTGGTGGSGGGGNGGTGLSNNSTAGTANTGGGGGGNNQGSTSSAGGSGIVIVRYPV